MDKKKEDAIRACTTFDELLDVEYGKLGTPERDKFEAEAEAFCLAECLKEQRRLAGCGLIRKMRAKSLVKISGPVHYALP